MAVISLPKSDPRFEHPVDNTSSPMRAMYYAAGRNHGVNPTRMEALRILDEAIEEMSDAY